MTDEDQRNLDKYGIAAETRTVFLFQGHRYDRLSDAINYAEQSGVALPLAKRMDEAE